MKKYYVIRCINNGTYLKPESKGYSSKIGDALIFHKKENIEDIINLLDVKFCYEIVKVYFPVH